MPTFRPSPHLRSVSALQSALVLASLALVDSVDVAAFGEAPSDGILSPMEPVAKTASHAWAAPQATHVYVLALPKSDRLPSLYANLAQHGYTRSSITHVDAFALGSPEAARMNASLPSQTDSPVDIFAKRSECMHYDSYYINTPTRSKSNCEANGGNFLGHLEMLERAARAHGDVPGFTMFLEDDARLQPDYERQLESVLNEQPLGTWEVLHMTGGGTPPALRPPLSVPHAINAADWSEWFNAVASGAENANDLFEPWMESLLVLMQSGYVASVSSAAYLIPNNQLAHVARVMSVKSPVPQGVPITFDLAMSLKSMMLPTLPPSSAGVFRVLDSYRCLAFPQHRSTTFVPPTAGEAEGARSLTSSSEGQADAGQYDVKNQHISAYYPESICYPYRIDPATLPPHLRALLYPPPM